MQKNKELLEHGDIRLVLLQYALPSAVSGIVGAVYNIVDQIFIGHLVGMPSIMYLQTVFTF